MNLFSANKTKIEEDVHAIDDIQNKELDVMIGEEPAEELREELKRSRAFMMNLTGLNTAGDIAPVFLVQQ